MKVPSVSKKILTNKFVLNAVTVIAVLNMLGYLVSGHITPILFFIVLAILTTYFSKNMIIVLGIPLILVNLFVISRKTNVEGMETNTNNTVDKEQIKDAIKSKKDSNSNTSSSKSKQDLKTKQGLPITPIDSTTNTDESFEVGRAKKRGGGYEIDYASTIEDAYDQLNSILGSDGIKRLTDDTQKLMKQQMQLAESMQSMAPMIKNMEPMMNQAKSLLEGMDDNNSGLGGIMDLAKKFGSSSNKK
jgi:hypothetical protein